MLRKHSEFFKNLLFISDLVIICIAWLLAYYVRFYSGLPVRYAVPEILDYLLNIIPILIIWFLIFRFFNLYRPKRVSSHIEEIFDITKACTLSVIILVAAIFFFRKFELSRMVIAFFWVFSITGLSFSRIVFREILRFIRRKGYNFRNVIIVGDGALARELIKRFNGHPELGFNIIGLLGRKKARKGVNVAGVEVIGVYGDIGEVLKESVIDYIFIAIPFTEMQEIEKALDVIGNSSATIKVVPDFRYLRSFCGSMEEFDGLAMLNIQDSPLYGWNILSKRCLDIVVSIIAIILTAPLMTVIAGIIKLTSPGPVFFTQRRSGFNGKVFGMLKFRTMRVDAEEASGPVWTSEKDPRRTSFGIFLRKTSLDELPQFINVLRGDMSVVGPRPERPEFIEEFKNKIPKYMLRLKMKAGITGWSQVNGWRGNTSLEKRIECDLFYIENWSIFFDIKIILLTAFKVLKDKNAY